MFFRGWVKSDGQHLYADVARTLTSHVSQVVVHAHCWLLIWLFGQDKHGLLLWFTGLSSTLSFHPSPLTYLLASLSFNMLKTNMSKPKKSSNTSSKTASSGTCAPCDIDLSNNPQNILPSNVQHLKKITTKQKAMSKYAVFSKSNMLTFCLQILRNNRRKPMPCKRDSRSF